MGWFFNNPARRDGVRRTIGALKALGYDKKILKLKHDPIIPSEAAGQLRIETGSIVQSLPCLIGVHTIIAFISGDHVLRAEELPRCLGVNGVIKEMGEEEAKEKLGFVLRGIAPVAIIKKEVLMVIDVSLKRFDKIFIPAGHPQCYFATTLKELTVMTEGIISYAIAKPENRGT